MSLDATLPPAFRERCALVAGRGRGACGVVVRALARMAAEVERDLLDSGHPR